ncbi:hypothetical protein Adt_02901 [Abeliophyllum distichum]|uniref:Uncharacterized protein n=1 Tax=Abeliophyllum distichum TaxID=126358 RepID=A0ABD1VZE8_9LAMI
MNTGWSRLNSATRVLSIPSSNMVSNKSNFHTSRNLQTQGTNRSPNYTAFRGRRGRGRILQGKYLEAYMPRCVVRLDIKLIFVCLHSTLNTWAMFLDRPRALKLLSHPSLQQQKQQEMMPSQLIVELATMLVWMLKIGNND